MAGGLAQKVPPSSTFQRLGDETVDSSVNRGWGLALSQIVR